MQTFDTEQEMRCIIQRQRLIEQDLAKSFMLENPALSYTQALAQAEETTRAWAQ